MKAPPLFVSFSNADRLLSALDSVDEEEERAIKELADDDLPPATSIDTISTLFGYSRRFIATLRKVPEDYYRSFSISKGDGTRTIYAPRVALKIIQKWFGEHVSKSAELHDSVHGFVPDRSLISAADQHAPAEWVASIDVRDFFPSTPAKRVRSALSNLGYPKRAVDTIVPLLTYQGTLPQGSPASPVLANLCFSPADRKVEKVKKNLDATYTRYADDLVFSGTQSNIEPMKIRTLQKVCTEEIESSTPYEINEAKTSVAIRPERVTVHGLTVHSDHPKLPREYRNRIRMMRHMLEENPEDLDEDTRNEFRGHVAFADSVRAYSQNTD